MVPAVVSAIAGVPLGFQQIVLSGAAQSLTPPAGATLAVISATVLITWRDDGTAPAVGTGVVLPANTPMSYAATLSKFQLIGASGAGNNANISYYG